MVKELKPAVAKVLLAVSAVPSSTRPPYGFVSHAEWAPATQFVSHAGPSDIFANNAAAATAAATAVAPPAATVRPPHGFVSHAEWAPATPFVTHAVEGLVEQEEEEEAPVSTLRNSIIVAMETVGSWLTPRSENDDA